MESTTMAGMTEPAPLAATLAPLAQRLKARGIDPDAVPDDAFSKAETPEEKLARHRLAIANHVARWDALVPAMYRAASVDDLDENQHGPQVRAWLASGSLHLVLAGPVGTGKTHAAYAVGNQALEHGLSVEAWNVGDLLDALRPGSSDRDAEGRARDCRVLILDDLVAKATEWEAERMTLLLDARVRAGLQTVVSTNITGQQVTEVWGSRFMDRLRFRMVSLTFQGESRRAAW